MTLRNVNGASVAIIQGYCVPGTTNHNDRIERSAALKTSGALPENVNYAIKSSYLLSLLESVPEVAAKLIEPNTKGKRFEDVVKEAEQAAVLVLVY